MRSFLQRHGKLLTLIVGFLFSTMGALWALLVTDRLDAQIQKLGDAKSMNVSQITTLNRLASEYFIANQQGDLIFILQLQPGTNRDLAGDIYKGNILDRATPVQNMIGELARERQLDFRPVYDGYMRLNQTARADLTFDNFMRLKKFEAEVIMQGQNRVPELVKVNNELDQALLAKQAAQSRNHVMAVLVAILGSAVLLAANLISERAPPAASASSAPVAPG
ncbi:MAG: hypothetical protein FGM50_05315 [Mycobacterium sp.]|nr:hypothetical protein [Mycobacterium sp.]